MGARGARGNKDTDLFWATELYGNRLCGIR